MNEDKQLENIKILAEALRKNLNITELTLIGFNDEFRKYISKNSPTNISDVNIMLNGLIENQTEYAKFKTKILNIIAPLCP
jgi:hypothetical protein